MTSYKAYLIDLDGTIYRGDERIPYAREFVEKLHQKGIPYLFVTNNSSKTPKQVSDKLVEMGIRSTPDHVFTTSMATARYIKQQKSTACCYMIGEEGLQTALKDEGLMMSEGESADFVIVGLDRHVTYEKLTEATLAVRRGASFLSTNGDVSIPTERGLAPGNGAITAVVSTSTGQTPIFIGKPNEIMMEQAMQALNVNKEDVLMVGDNYDTDILAGIQSSVDTLMVFTGVTPYHDLPTLDPQPTYAVKHLNEWIQHI